MEKKEIEKVIRGYFRRHFFEQPSCFSDVVWDSIQTARTLAESYWEFRTLAEIKRDRAAEVTESDYEDWVLNELLQLKMGAFRN